MTIEAMARIEWHGGENPVQPGEKLKKMWLRGDYELTANDDGSAMRWSHEGNGGDIIAYAVTPERACSPPAKAPTIDAVEAVARALADLEIDSGEGSTYRLFELLDFSGENQTRIVIRALAQAALAAARPFIAAEWQPIETAPHDHHFIAAIEVQSSVAPTRWQMDVVFIDSETGELGYDCDFGWSIGDYSHWHPLPTPPTAIKETIR